jgi:hypothetical protein
MSVDSGGAMESKRRPAGHTAPYQNVNGCAVAQPSPNGPVVDSQASVLSHETTETITDPDGSAWWNTVSLDLYRYETADECQNSTFVYQTPTINGMLY